MTSLFQKYNIPVPRYTSYPTAPHFHTEIGHDTVAGWLAAIPAEEPISLYLHIPFCRQLCYYCGCHMKVVNGNDATRAYAETLVQEITQTARRIGRRQPVSHIHWGGGTPSITPPDCLTTLVKTLQKEFDILPTAEHAMELDPRVLNEDYIALLADLGLTRASLGVQDFDQKVQQAINRVQPFAEVQQVVTWLRKHGIEHINFDLIYGLPEQTQKTISRTISQTVELAPSRIALFGYAHVPWMKKHQKLLEKYDLPNAPTRQNLFDFAATELEQAGYTRIGYDHFAQPNDAMATALHNNTLHRNFQGFTVDNADVLVGLGASSISQLPHGYAQNYGDIAEYRARVENNLPAIQRGVAVTAEDTLRRRLIERLMCDYTVNIPAVCQQNNQSLTQLADVWPKLTPLLEDGLATLSDDHILTITTIGHPFVRVVAACFDAYFTPQANRHAQAV